MVEDAIVNLVVSDDDAIVRALSRVHVEEKMTPEWSHGFMSHEQTPSDILKRLPDFHLSDKLQAGTSWNMRTRVPESSFRADDFEGHRSSLHQGSFLDSINASFINCDDSFAAN